jgi:DNA invertase Pin-like site-specific DNA recombinase
VKPCIIYARYSARRRKLDKAGDAIEPESISNQIARCKEYCAMQHLEVGLVIEDPFVSAATLDLNERKGGAELLEALRSRKYGHVVVQRIDRLWRHPAHCLATVDRWAKKKIVIHLADQGGCSINAGTSVGYFMIGQLALAAKLERDMTVERTSQAMKRYALTRSHGSAHVKFGLMPGPDGHVACEEELLAIERIKALRAEKLSLRKIGRALEAEGILCRGKRWHPDTIRGILAH